MSETHIILYGIALDVFSFIPIISLLYKTFLWFKIKLNFNFTEDNLECCGEYRRRSAHVFTFSRCTDAVLN